MQKEIGRGKVIENWSTFVLSKTTERSRKYILRNNRWFWKLNQPRQSFSTMTELWKAKYIDMIDIPSLLAKVMTAFPLCGMCTYSSSPPPFLACWKYITITSAGVSRFKFVTTTLLATCSSLSIFLCGPRDRIRSFPLVILHDEYLFRSRCKIALIAFVSGKIGLRSLEPRCRKNFWLFYKCLPLLFLIIVLACHTIPPSSYRVDNSIIFLHLRVLYLQI